MKKILNVVPELFFMGLGLYWLIDNYSDSGHINYLSILSVWLLFLQLIYKNRILGLIYGTIMAMVSGYLLLTVVSGFTLLPDVDTSAYRFLALGGGLFAASFIMAAGMLYKFAIARTSYSENEFTISF